MSYISELNKDIGEIKEKERAIIVFSTIPNAPKIIDVHPFCGCTKYSFDKKQIVVTYKPDRIPYHIRRYQSQIVEKKVRVIFEDETEEIIKIIAKIIL